MAFGMEDQTLAVRVTGKDAGVGNVLSGLIGNMSALKLGALGAATAVAGLATAFVKGGVKAAMKFESAMVEVEKVTDPETAEEMAEAIRDMTLEMPMAAEGLADIAAAGGRMGIEGVENLEQFTGTVSRMVIATDLMADEAGTAFAKLTTLLQEPISEVEGLGSAINELSNNAAASSSEIVDAMLRSSGALKSLGAGTEEVLALNTAMNEVEPSARLAGTGLRTLAEALMDPKKVNKLAHAFGMTGEEFRNMRDNNPVEMIGELAEVMNEGGEPAEFLRETLGKQADTLDKLGRNWESVEDGIRQASEQLVEQTSLQDEATAAMDTTESKLAMLNNAWTESKRLVGDLIIPTIADLAVLLRDTLVSAMDFAQRHSETLAAVWRGLVAPFELTIGAMKAAFGSWVRYLRGAIETYTKLLHGDFYGAWNSFVSIWRDIGDIWLRYIRDSINKILGWFGTDLSGVWQVVSQEFADFVTRFKIQWLELQVSGAGAINAIIDLLNKYLMPTFDDTGRYFQLFINTMKLGWADLKRFIVDTLGSVVGAFRKISEAGPVASAFMPPGFKDFATTIVEMYDGMAEDVKANVTAIQEENARLINNMGTVQTKIGKFDLKPMRAEIDRLRESLKDTAPAADVMADAISETMIASRSAHTQVGSLNTATYELAGLAQRAKDETTELNYQVKEGGDTAETTGEKIKTVNEIMSEHKKALQEAAAMERLLGDEFNSTREKANIYKNTLTLLVQNGHATTEQASQMANAYQTLQDELNETTTSTVSLDSVMSQLGEQIDLIDQKAKVLGDDYDATSKKINAHETALNTLIENGYKPSQAEVQKLAGDLAALKAQSEDTSETIELNFQSLADTLQGVAEGVKDAFVSNFEAVLTGSKSLLQGVQDFVSSAVDSMISQLARLAGNQIFRMLIGGSGTLGSIGGVATGGGGLLSGLLGGGGLAAAMPWVAGGLLGGQVLSSLFGSGNMWKDITGLLGIGGGGDEAQSAEQAIDSAGAITSELRTIANVNREMARTLKRIEELTEENVGLASELSSYGV